jgi:hypothetical protein
MPPSREVAAPCRVYNLNSLAPSLVQRSPHALGLHRLDFRVFTIQAPKKHVSSSWVPLMGLKLLFRGCPSTEPLPLSPWFPKNSDARFEPDAILQRLPCGLRPLQRFPCPEQRHEMAGHASPNRLRLQVFTTSWRLHPPRACRPCFMPDPLLGSPSRALFLPRSRTLFPAPFPS